jgi:predicted Zn-dependent protease
MDKNSRAFFNSVEGDILYELGDGKNAEKMYRDALKDQPLLAGALLGLGKVMLDANKTKLAISYMERAVRVNPRITEAHYLLAKAFEPTDKEKALKYYQYFRKQASADPEFIAKLNEVKTKIGMLQK